MLLTTSGVAISGILTLTSGDSDASGAGTSIEGISILGASAGGTSIEVSGILITGAGRAKTGSFLEFSLSI